MAAESTAEPLKACVNRLRRVSFISCPQVDPGWLQISVPKASATAPCRIRRQASQLLPRERIADLLHCILVAFEIRLLQNVLTHFLGNCFGRGLLRVVVAGPVTRIQLPSEILRNALMKFRCAKFVIEL